MNLIKIEIYETVKARLKARADMTIKNNKGETPLQLKKNDAIKALLLQAQIQSLQAQLQ